MSHSRERAFPTARRDNNPIHALRKSSASDDFFTDSLLDSSRIPTPSPSKKDTTRASASKPRRAIGNTRTLKAAWDATASSGRRSSAGSDLESVKENFKSTPAQARRRSPSGPAEPHPTPSPPRGRQTTLSLASPISDASSPPRGLNDVYQRIADEERLASQEEEVEEDNFTDSTMTYNDHTDEDRARLNRIRSSQSPLNFRSSSRNTPQPQAADHNKENQSVDAGLTDASGMSFLENMTDQVLAAKLTPHTQDRARDRARLDKAVQKTTPLAFSKAQVGSRHALTKENLQRSGRRENLASAHAASNGSMPNEDATPPPNVPRAWGTKGRVDKDWLRKIHDRSGSPADIVQNGDKDHSAQIDWTATAADVPLPSVEDSLTPRPEHELSKQSSLDRIRQWELNDFTGHNLQVSESPPVRVRSIVPGHVRDREIETLEKRAVTTNRLGEIRKNNSRELLVGKARSLSSEVPKGAEHIASEHNEAIPRIEEEGESIPDTPIVVFKASTNGIKKDGDSKTRPLHDRKDSRDSLQRLARAMSESPMPSSTPEDWSLIKDEEAQAARSEVRKLEKMKNESRKSSKEVVVTHSPPSVKRSRSADAARTPVVTGAWTDTILPDTIKTVKQRHAPSKYAQTPHVTGGWIDTPLATGERQSSALAPMSVDELSEKPATDQLQDGSKPSGREDIDPKSITRRASKLPRSALSSLLTKAKRKLVTTNQKHSPIAEEGEDITNSPNNDTLNLGDATIESLEDLLTLDNADMTTLLRMGAEFDAREPIKSRKLQGETQDRDRHDKQDTGWRTAGTEAELLERLGTKLERLRTNIHDARKGISKLEEQVSHPPPASSTGTELVRSNSGGVSPCQNCGCPRGTTLLSLSSSSSSSTTTAATPASKAPTLYFNHPIPIPRTITLPIPRLWHTIPKSQLQTNKQQRWHHLPPHRPTFLGYLTLHVTTVQYLIGWLERDREELVSKAITDLYEGQEKY